MVEVLDVKIDWNLGYATSPDIAFLVETMPNYRDIRFHKIEMEPGHNYIIGRSEPITYFISEYVNAKGHFNTGALGGTFTLVDGTEYRSNGGWSSREGVVNNYRQEMMQFASLLPYELVDVSLYENWGRTGRAGFYFDEPFVREMMEKYLPKNVALMRELSYRDEEPYWHPVLRKPIGWGLTLLKQTELSIAREVARRECR